MNSPIFRLTDIVKRYGERTVVDVPRLEIAAGEVLAIVGPSGAGKSTLLRLLNWLEPPTSGQLYYRGQELQATPASLELRRQVTTVFQRPALLNLDVFGNVAFGLRLRGRPSNGRVSHLLSQVGLSELKHAPARRLSGGEMQRVALARALVVEPSVLLLDEPTANLDPYNVGLLEEIVRRHNQERGMTVVLVTHNIFQARRLADRVALMLSGHIVEIAESHEFFESPRDPRTRAFVGGDMVY